MLDVVRKNLPPLALSLSLDVTTPFTRQITGTLRENGVDVAAITGDQAIYTAKKNPAPPFVNVPATLLNPATEKVSHTAIFAALSPAAQGMAATDFPQGDGYALVKVLKTGKVTLAGKLADGTPFSASNFLSQDNFLPLFLKLQGSAASLAGFVRFRDQPATDVDGADLRWFKPASTKGATYRSGWPLGIGVDIAGSKFVAPKVTGLTALGNLPSPSPERQTPFAKLPTHSPSGRSRLSFPLTLEERRTTRQFRRSWWERLATSGLFVGSHLDHSGALRVSHAGVVLQKSQTASGFFLIAPAAVPKDPKQSGRVTITAQ
jgi:hypothetical protein